MYVCGITPYDATHLGHANTYLAFDLVNRVWRDAGHEVHFTQNATDVDDPLLERAGQTGIDWRDLAEREIELFRTDMEALRILPPRDYVAVTEVIDQVADLVASLRDKGATYDLDGDVYFDVAAAPKFGAVSGYSEERMLALFGERGEIRTGRARSTRSTGCSGARSVRGSRPGPRRSAWAGPAGTSSAPRSPWRTCPVVSTSPAAVPT